jgi:hypothetical protein
MRAPPRDYWGGIRAIRLLQPIQIFITKKPSTLPQEGEHGSSVPGSAREDASPDDG